MAINSFTTIPYVRKTAQALFKSEKKKIIYVFIANGFRFTLMGHYYVSYYGMSILFFITLFKQREIAVRRVCLVQNHISRVE